MTVKRDSHYAYSYIDFHSTSSFVIPVLKSQNYINLLCIYHWEIYEVLKYSVSFQNKIEQPYVNTNFYSDEQSSG